MKRTQQGFTLIELMIVVAIIGILAAIAIPAYQDYTIRAKVSEAIITTGSAKVAVEEYRTSEGRWPSDQTIAGIGSLDTKYTESLTYENDCSLAATKGDVTFNANGPCIQVAIEDVDPEVDSGVIVIEPSFVEGAIDWACGALVEANLETKYRPSTCRDFP